MTAIKPINEYPVMPLPAGRSKDFAVLCMMDLQGDIDEETKEAVRNDRIASIISSRAHVPLTELALLGLIEFSNAEAIGSFVLLAHAIYVDYHRKQMTGPYTFDDLVRLFPNGFPTAKSYSAAWAAQKGHTYNQPHDNLIDVFEWWSKENNESTWFVFD